MKEIKTFITFTFLIFFVLSCGKLFDSKKPEITILSPQQGEKLLKQVKIEVTAKDNKGVERIEIYINDDIKAIIKSSAGNYTYDFSSEVKQANYTIKARAYDKAGNCGEALVTFSGNVELPSSPTLIKPAKDAIFTKEIVDFEWSAVPDAIAYQFQIDDDDDFVNEGDPTPIEEKETKDPQYNKIFIKYATYYWRVRAKDKEERWGNWSLERRKLIINIPSVDLKVIKTSPTSIDLQWTKYEGLDFASYQIYRNTDKGVSTNSDLVKTIKDKNIISYKDEKGLTVDKKYYYKVFVFLTPDKLTKIELLTESNEVEVSASIPSVELMEKETEVIEITSITLKWTKYTGQDFKAYKIYRSTAKNVTPSSGILIKAMEDISTYFYKDENLIPGQKYYYKIFVYNTKDEFAGSNELEITPKVPSITFKILVDVNSLKLEWNKYPGNIFSKYKIYRALTKGVTILSTLVKEIEDVNTLSYTDTNLITGQEYFYKIYVYATSEYFSESTEVSNKPVVPTIILKSTGVTANSVSLTWDKYPGSLFSRYKLYRGTSEGVNTLSTLITEITDIETISYTDINLITSQKYFYKIYVFVNTGEFSVSKEINAVPK